MTRLNGFLCFLLFLANNQKGECGQDNGRSDEGEKQAVHFDFQGDPLPADAISRIGTTRMRHGHRVWDVVFFPDGKTLASAGHDHSVRLWDVSTGKEIGRFTNEEERVKPFSLARWCHCIAVSPDGKMLACGYFADGWQVNTMRIWEVATGKLLHEFQGPRGGVLALAFSPNGAVLALGGLDRTISLWDPTTGQRQSTWIGHEGAVRSVAFSKDGKMLASAGDDHTVRLWDTGNNKELFQMRGHQAEVESVCFTPDGKSLVSGSGDKTVRLWDTDTGKERAVWQGHQDAVLRVAIAPDGKTAATASRDKTIQLWDVATGKNVASLKGHHLEVRGLSFSPDSKTLASASWDQCVYLWDVKTGNKIHPQPGHGDAAIAVHFINGGKTLLSMGRDDSIRWWNWRTGKQEREIPWQAMLPGAASFSPMGDLMALGSNEGSVRLLIAASGKELGQLEGSKRPTQSVTFSADSKTVAISDGINTKLWDVAARKVIRQFGEEAAGNKFLLFAPDGKLLLGGETQSILWDVAKNILIRRLPLSFTSLQSAAFSPDSRLLACGDMYGKVELWDIESAEKVREFTGLVGYVSVLAFSPDGRLLTAGAWRGIKIWELATGYVRREYHDFEGDAFSLAFTPDGRALASGVGGTAIIVWDIQGNAMADGAKVAQSPQEFEAFGKDLAGSDGKLAHQAIWGLVARQDKSVPYLKTLFKPANGADDKTIAQLTKDLDSNVFAVREKASQALQKLGDVAEPSLKKLLTDPAPPEVQQRAREILQKLAEAPMSSEKLLALRALEALEYIATPDARSLLRKLAEGKSAVHVRREAAASLKRLSRTPAAPR